MSNLEQIKRSDLSFIHFALPEGFVITAGSELGESWLWANTTVENPDGNYSPKDQNEFERLHAKAIADGLNVNKEHDPR